MSNQQCQRLVENEKNDGALLEEGLQSVVSVPLDFHGTRLGVLSLSAYDPDVLGAEGLLLLQEVAAHLSGALHRWQGGTPAGTGKLGELAERLAFERKLRTALEEQRFELHYQPQVDIDSGRIESVEALLRWNDPELGLVAPDRFLPLLESSGLIVPVGDWVLRQAVRDARRWRRLGFGPLRVAVNVSAIQIRQPDFVRRVLDAVGTSGSDIDIEITETGLLQDVEDTSRKLNELRAAGIRVAIDDFGTGYSSLGLLPRLPVDVLKIDRSFIRGLPSDKASVALVSSIIGLAFAFDLTTVAEGVETTRQHEMLRALKCRQSQGFLHARPLPAARLESLLAQGRVSRYAEELRHAEAAVG